MVQPGRTAVLICAVAIIALGAIHLAVAINVVVRYRQFRDVFRQPVGLSAFNIVIGAYAVAIGVLSLIAAMQERPSLSKSAAIASTIVCVFAIVSLIVALILNSQAISYVRARLSYHMNAYVENEDSVNIMDIVQTRYKCCGENLWLDWGRAGLGAAAGAGTGVVTNTGTGTGVVTNTGTGAGVVTNTGTGTGTGTLVTTNSGAGTRIIADMHNVFRRTVNMKKEFQRYRRSLSFQSDPLSRAIRKSRQILTGGNAYGLPSSYSINLPVSCCKNAATTSGNTIGGYCVYTGGNSTTPFYVGGCIPPVANIVVVQITATAVINVCLAIVSFVIIPLFIKMFPTAFDPSNPQNKAPSANQMQQEPVYQNGSYYVYAPNPNGVNMYANPQYTYFQTVQ